MNKTLMLVICDFLLLSMLAIARFDSPEALPEVTLDAAASSASTEAELVSLLEESLAAELNSRSELDAQLAETRQHLDNKARKLAQQETALAQTQQQLAAQAARAEQLASAKASMESEQQSLSAAKAEIEAERQQLADRFEQTRTKLEDANSERVQLAHTLAEIKAQRSQSQQRLTVTEQQLIDREVQLAQREAELRAAQQKAERLDREREALSRRLDVAQAERALLEQNLSQEQQEKAVLQAEKTEVLAHANRLNENVSQLGAGLSQLGQGVTELAHSSEAIQKEMDASRPRTMSEIFTHFQNNRATLRFSALEKPRIGSAVKRHYESQSILIADDSGTYLVTHSADTPFALHKNPNSVLEVELQVSLGNKQFAVPQIAFLNSDPRLLYIPLPASYVAASEMEPFALSLQPERWEEAVLIKNDASNFGRSGFRRLTSSARFLKIERPVLGALFAEFASSRGDLAFTKNNQFIGVLSNSKHAVVIDAFLACAIADLGRNFDPQANAATIERLRDRVRKLPAAVRQ